jgi:hypothetical protein
MTNAFIEHKTLVTEVAGDINALKGRVIALEKHAIYPESKILTSGDGYGLR